MSDLPELKTPTHQQSDEFVQRIDAAVLANQAIPYREKMPDRENPAVLWWVYGLVKTNEMAVIAKSGDKRFGFAHESWLFYPAMIDRMFGMDVLDDQLAAALADALWPLVKEATGA